MDANTVSTLSLIFTVGIAAWNIAQQWSIVNLKQQQNKDLFIHKLQFEKEFNIYIELWSTLVDLREAIVKFRPSMEWVSEEMINNPNEEHIKRWNRVIEVGNVTISFIEKHKPFYSETIYNDLDKILKIIHLEVKQGRQGVTKDQKYWEMAEKNSNDLVQFIEKVCQDIRRRIIIIEKNK